VWYLPNIKVIDLKTCTFLHSFGKSRLLAFGSISYLPWRQFVKRTGLSPPLLAAFSSGVSLGGKVLRYRVKENIYSQGMPAPTLFYIQEGGVRLTVQSKVRSSAVTSILGPNDFFGELCLMGYGLRRSTADALTDCVILAIPKGKMMTLLR
jgi:CRP/FNR family transcriptional regulator, cyclic AMP receptor protein